MESEKTPHALRPDRPPRVHILPRRWRRTGTPSGLGGEHGEVRGTALPEESGHGRGDNWAALKAGAMVLAGAAVVTWLLVALLR